MTLIRLFTFLLIYLVIAKGVFELLQVIDMRGLGVLAYVVWGLFLIGLLASLPLPFYLAGNYGKTRLGFKADMYAGFNSWIGLCNMTLMYFIGLFVIFSVMYALSLLIY